MSKLFEHPTFRRVAWFGAGAGGLLTLVGAVEDAGIYFQLMAQQLPVLGNLNPGNLWG